VPGVRRMRLSQGPYAARESWTHGLDGLTKGLMCNKTLNFVLETRKNEYVLDLYYTNKCGVYQ
jgi:hypothetical protein